MCQSRVKAFLRHVGPWPITLPIRAKVIAGTVIISRAPGALRFSTYGGPASDLPLISDVHEVVTSGSRLGEQSQAQVTRTQRYIQGV
jgi:hypothetical protein